jgi:membrane protein implicated in regulation of membrane protease activity
MSSALLIPVAAVATGVVVIVVAIAVVLVVLFVTLSMRGRQRRSGKRQRELADAHERAARAEHDRDVAQDQARQNDPDS